MTKSINAAIIGCGSIHKVHAGVLGMLPGVRLAAVCDVKPERAEASTAEHHCASYTDYRELLKDSEIDAVHICTPHWLHGAMALDALAAGKYVLVEKPMAVSVAEARAMIAADGALGGRHLCVVFQNRYNGATRALKDIADEGRYGALQCVRGSVVWRRGPEYYSDDWHGKKALECGGVLVNQAIHTLDIVQWLCGGAASVKGSATTDALMGVVEVEDSAHMHIQMKSGVPAVFYATVAYGTHSPVEVEAVFERATFLLRGNALYRTDTDFELVCDPCAVPLGERDYWGSGHLAQLEDFYRCIREDRPFFIDGLQGIEAVKLVFGLYESSETGRVVTI